MALQTSGAISLANVQTEFGGVNPISISEYYGKAAGIPASGTISLSHFYGKSNIIREPESGDYFDVNSSYSFRYAAPLKKTSIFWNSTTLLTMLPGDVSSFVSEGYTYYRGQYRYTLNQVLLYGIYRIKN